MSQRYPTRRTSDNRYQFKTCRTYPLAFTPFVIFLAWLLFPLPPAVHSAALTLGSDQPVGQTERVLVYLAKEEIKECDPWMRDDRRIAWLIVRFCQTGEAVECTPHVLATYRVLGCHPDQVWPRIMARRAALLGPESIPHKQKKPMAESRGGFAPQKTCAYGAQGDLTGTSCSTETKHEARRTLTSEFGLDDAPPAGVAAPAVRKPVASERRGTQRRVA